MYVCVRVAGGPRGLSGLLCGTGRLTLCLPPPELHVQPSPAAPPGWRLTRSPARRSRSRWCTCTCATLCPTCVPLLCRATAPGARSSPSCWPATNGGCPWTCGRAPLANVGLSACKHRRTPYRREEPIMTSRPLAHANPLPHCPSSFLTLPPLPLMVAAPACRQLGGAPGGQPPAAGPALRSVQHRAHREQPGGPLYGPERREGGHGRMRRAGRAVCEGQRGRRGVEFERSGGAGGRGGDGGAQER
jgi:hypothetical protein